MIVTSTNRWRNAIFVILCVAAVSPLKSENDIEKKEITKEKSKPIANEEHIVEQVMPSTADGEPQIPVPSDTTPATTNQTAAPGMRKITAITVVGTHFIPNDAITDRIPYKIGQIFDPRKTRKLIHNLYYDLKRVKNVSVYGQADGSDGIHLYIAIEEKYPLLDVKLIGNEHVSEKEIKKQIDFETIPAIDEHDLNKIAQVISKLYKEKGYQAVTIKRDLETDENNRATAVFTITENKKAVVQQIKFIGNENIHSKKLRGAIFSKEDWLFGFMDKSGTLQTDRLEADKHMIEQFYQNNGYLNAKVIGTKIETDPETQNTIVTFDILEGPQYTFDQISALGNDILAEEQLLSVIPIKTGDLYSREKIVNAIKSLEFIWGDRGYAYAHIEPAVQPNDETQTVSVTFHSELGKPVLLNKLNVIGNRKTKDKVIRRKISLEEGGLITNRQMESTKHRLESSGYFERGDGVNWKMIRLDEETADLELILKEAKTGSAHVKVGFGGAAGNIKSPSSAFSAEAEIRDSNLFGSGISFNLTGNLAKDAKTFSFNATNPWLFDRPFLGAIDLYHKRTTYDNFCFATCPVTEKLTGGALSFGWVTSLYYNIFADTSVKLVLGLDNVAYEGKASDGKRCDFMPAARIKADNRSIRGPADRAYEFIQGRGFNPGAYGTVSASIGKDTRNHPLHTSRGYVWFAKPQLSFPAFGCKSKIGFGKFTIDAQWFTPLIGEYDLVLHLHGFAGIVEPINNQIIPYRELFNLGGPASVRGFLFGNIGPQFSARVNNENKCDPIGGKKAFFVNTELIFPITNDFTMKGVVFYDGGASWTNPYTNCKDKKGNCCVPPEFIKENNFRYRHSVGFGLRLLNPMPIRIDWGFKLDARKGEPQYEVHFGSSYAW